MASHFLERIKANAVTDALIQAQWAEKKWVWVADKKEGYLQASIVSENGDEVVIQMADNTKRTVNINDTEKMNPPKFDLVEDMAELTHLNEASVVHNLKLRYFSNLIYTYSGLFCVTVNPYKKLPIYTDDVIKAYRGKKRSEMPPHVYCTVDEAYNDMVNNRENQSILVTGESGAGKTENTKKVIQYLAASSGSGQMGTLETQILQANPLLEAFGNAQTIRNNNSSRFGKFVRIEFNASGQIAGANIERYLLEKSRVTHQTPKERNYHIFYQLLKGASPELQEMLLLKGTANDYRFTKNSSKNIDGVDDGADFKDLIKSLTVLNINEAAQNDLFRVIAAILHLGNITLQADREDNANLTTQAAEICEKVCHVLGIPLQEFTRSLLKPRIKAGRDWVTQARNVEQVYYSIEALARSLYERMFGSLLDRINETLYTTTQKASFIGVLDIAGFEIFDKNSFEQLCINYTNERLQQFFNHHMFILEQEEYKREGIEWKFIDFGLDLQPAIDLIEKTTPIGILSLLDEECVMPKGSDKTFIDKLNGLWKGNSPKYDLPKFNAGFILTHYAGKVEYTVNGWLDKNKDPLNENVTKLLSASSLKFISVLFEDSVGEGDSANLKSVGVTKKGAFRTVAQKHKESLNSLMNQLYSTQPHFVRCIIPNEEKKPGKVDLNLVLSQLRCNGVLEGIRICRAGFPNRLIFQDFKSRYEVLAVGVIPKGYIEGRKAATMLLDHLALDKNQYRVGASKVFFKSGVLADLENLRDIQLSKIVVKIQAMIRGYLGRKLYRRQIEQFRAIKIIQRNARIYVVLKEWSWWKLYSKVKPLLNVTRTDEELKKRDEVARIWEEKANKEAEEKNRIEALRLALEQEKKRIEDILQSEKNASADQAEILARTQKREIDLNERLAEILRELEEKDSQNETLLDAKKKLEHEIRQLQVKSAADSTSIDHLEKEKASKDLRMKKIEAALAGEHERVEKLEGDKKSGEAQIIGLEERLRSIGEDQSELSKQKVKLQASFKEFEQKFEHETSEKKKLELKKGSLEQELADAKNTIADLERIKADLEITIKKRENEISNLNESLAKQGVEKDNIELQRRELSIKLQSVQDDLENEKSEKEKLLNQKKRVEDEVEELHHLMEQKGNEETKQGEFRRLREQEVSNLKSQLESIQSDLDDTRKKGYLAIERLNFELDSVRQEGYCRIEKTLMAMTSKSDEYESKCSSLEREKATALRNVETLTEELEQEIHKRTALDSQKKRLSVEYSDLQTRAEEEEVSKNDALSRLSSKSAELESFKEKYNSDVTIRTSSLEEAKKKVEKDLIEITARLEDQDRQAANLERTKTRLSTEIEDLKLEIEREHNNAKNAERLLKQVEAQVNAANLNAENERVQREVSETNARKLQASVDALNTELEKKTMQIASIQRSKNDLDSELKALINETGGGGKNVHEIEKAKRQLQSQIEDLTLQLEVEVAAKLGAEEAKKTLDTQFSEFRKKSELENLAKDTQMEETRRMLMKEINAIGEQLDDANTQKNEAIKQKKRLDEQVQDLMSAANNSAKGQSDLQKLKSKNEVLVRELQVRLEEEQKTRENLQELCYRHEKKANTLQSEIELIELQVDSVERTKKQLEKRVRELDSELNTGDDSKANLLEAKRKLTYEKESLEKQLQAVEDERDSLKEYKSVAGANTGVKGVALLEYEDKITKLEESRRALMAAQRLSVQELDEKTMELVSSEKAKKQLQQDLDDVKAQLETEILSKGEESASKRKLLAEQRDLQARFDAECLKTTELSDTLSLFKARADQSVEKLEAAEIGRCRSEKNESALRAQIKELESSLNESVAEKQSAIDRAKSFEDQILDLQAKLEENSHELADLVIAKRKLQDEFSKIHEHHRAEIDEREEIEEQARKKYQKELKSLIDDLDTEKTANLQLKESVRELDNEVQALNIKLDAELRSAILWKKEKGKLDVKLEDLTKNLGNVTLESQEREMVSGKLSNEIRELKALVEEKNSAILSMEKSRKSYEQRLHDLDLEFSQSIKTKSDMNRSVLELDKHNQELKAEMDEHLRDVESAEERAKRAEQHSTEIQQELTREHAVTIELEKSKVVLEKSLKELNSRLYELESLNLSRDTNTTRRLESRIDELQTQLESETREKGDHMKNSRKFERTVRDLQFQLAEKDKFKVRFDEEQEKADQKLKRMKQQLDELEISESNWQLAKRKAEREANEFREKALKYEKEVDRLKNRAPMSSV